MDADWLSVVAQSHADTQWSPLPQTSPGPQASAGSLLCGGGEAEWKALRKGESRASLQELWGVDFRQALGVI